MFNFWFSSLCCYYAGRREEIFLCVPLIHRFTLAFKYIKLLPLKVTKKFLTPTHFFIHHIIAITTTMTASSKKHPTMSATATLSNLYIPLPIAVPVQTYDPLSRQESSTEQPRSRRTLRNLHLTRSPLSQSTGSSLIELGNTKLLVSVRGPRSVSRCSFGKDGGLVCEGKFVHNIMPLTCTTFVC